MVRLIQKSPDSQPRSESCFLLRLRFPGRLVAVLHLRFFLILKLFKKILPPRKKRPRLFSHSNGAALSTCVSSPLSAGIFRPSPVTSSSSRSRAILVEKVHVVISSCQACQSTRLRVHSVHPTSRAMNTET